MKASTTAEYAEPYLDPKNPLRMDRHTGRCHICQRLHPISYCSFCGHWLCKEDRDNWYERGEAALKQVIGRVLVALWLKQSTGPCCGPMEVKP